jgi:hypothetical protein
MPTLSVLHVTTSLQLESTTALESSASGKGSEPCARDAETLSPRRTPKVGVTLIVDLGRGVGAEYARHAAGGNSPTMLVDDSSAPKAFSLPCLSRDAFLSSSLAALLPVERIVLFLVRTPSSDDDQVIERSLELAAGSPNCRVCLVTSFSIHLSDTQWLATETVLRARFERVAPGRCFVIRPGHIASGGSELNDALTTLAAFHPLVSDRFQSCFVGEAELYSAVDAIMRSGQLATGRTYTLLGTIRPLCDVLAERVSGGTAARLLSGISRAARFLSIGRMLGWLFGLLARGCPALNQWQCHTLEPTTFGELLSLYNPQNARHVAIAGYNTGVTHFGWKYPGRTVIKTTGCGKRIRLHGSTVDVDAGVTLKRVVNELNHSGRELFVLPNYSYISMGTTFFVPIHGSGSEVSTLGDTIEKVLLYDPTADRLVRLKRSDPRFREYMYNSQSGALALRLRLRIREKPRYYVRRTTLDAPSAADVWRLFAEPEASNVELRKSRAADTSVEVSKYYTALTGAADALEVPKDSIGRLWDRLEENWLTSWLFHTLVRRFGYHVELFLDEREFALFWASHATLPLAKLQLRFVRRDGLPHSPFGDRDRVSIDLFMRRSVSPAFIRFMKEQLPDARFNPGKHSM